MERSFTIVRAVVTLTVLVVWLASPPVPGTAHGPELAMAVAALAYSAATAILLFRLPDFASRLWPGYAIADLAMILACIATSGMQRTPFLPLLFIAAVTVPQRMPFAGGVAAAAVCTAAWALLAAPGQRYVAVFVAVIATLQVLATALMRSDRTAIARDPLTGCFGRSHVLADLARLVEGGELPFSLILVDLDNFKGVNDRFGHPVGDLVLQAASRHIAAAVRGDDLLARYGGDEFLVILGGTDGETARGVAERVRGAVAGSQLRAGAAADIRITLSAGVVEARPGQSVADLLASVDRLLYEAKRSRDRVAGDSAAAGMLG